MEHVRPRLPLALSILLLAGLLLAPAAPAAAQDESDLADGAKDADQDLTRLLRQPDIHGDTIVFSYAGDLWTVDAGGGVARRLTSHEGLEYFPKISPDGRSVAFTGEYGGNPQVHVIPIAGGTPRQLTFRNDVGDIPPRGGIDNRVLGWSPDGSKVLFSAHRVAWSDRIEIPYTVPFEGGMEEPLGVPRGSATDLNADGVTIAYTPKTREFRTWKRYYGGNAQDVWTFDLAAGTARQLTDYEGTDNQPMWVGDTIYFTSDREHGKLNLFAIDGDAPEGTAPRQVTDHRVWDVLWPSVGDREIVYEAGGWIWRLDTASGESVRVPIRVYGDFEGRVPYWREVASNVQDGDLSPTGARALFEARGDLFTAPAKEGEARNLTRSSGVRERGPVWSPDGARVAYWSDRSGEYELYVRPADGSGEERRLTNDGDDQPVWRYNLRWSPDGDKLAYSDHAARLRVIDVESGAITTADTGRFGDIGDHAWSPDSRWLAYTKAGESQLPSLWVYDLEGGERHQLTLDGSAEGAPAWDPKGRYLYFLSNRDFNLTFSAFEFDFVYTDPTRVYVALLQEDGPALLLPESDEEPVEEDESDAEPPAPPAEEKKPDAAAADEPVRVEIDVEGFERRIRALPGPPGQYRNLAGVPAGVLYLEGQGPETKLQLFDLEAEEEKTILEGIQDYALSASDDKVLYRFQGIQFGIAAAMPGQKAPDGKLDLADLEAKVDPAAEWRQQFVDAWRILRDWFYDPGMHGLDWEGIRERYEPMVDHVAHRADLDYLLGEIAGELSVGHAYVQPSGEGRIERTESALLGAEIESDPSGYFRVAKIFPGANWHEDFRSPLTDPGVDVEEGDLILAVDGVSTRTVENFFQLLEGRGDDVVTLTVASDASAGDSHEERVRPVTRETNLRYLEWVESRERYVEERSNGRIGYIHLPNTAVEGTRELYKGFYGQAQKDALILDDRFNGGGFIPDAMIELLERPLLSYWTTRNAEPFTTPGFVHRGPKAVLTNEAAGSGGDAFPYYFRQRGLGPVIGTTTWGGLIGVAFTPSLADGGTVTAPSFRFVTPDGLYAVEGVGVEPDIEVVDRPDLMVQGIDPSLDKAIEVLLQELEENPPEPLPIPEPQTWSGRGPGADGP